MMDLLFAIQILIPLLAILLLVTGFGFFAFALQTRKKPSARDGQDDAEPAVAWQSKSARRVEAIPARLPLTSDQLEDQLLSHIFRQPDLSRAIEEFLQRIAAASESGFAMIVGTGRHSPVKTIAVGLSRESIDRLRIPSDLVRRLRTENPLCLQRPAYGSTTFPLIPVAEQLQNSPQYLTALHDGDEIFAVLITSSTWPQELPEAERRPFMKRVARQIGMRWRRVQVVEQQSEELNSTRRMLELRSIVDAKSDEPMVTLQRFVSRLRESTDADRAAIYFVPRRAGDRLRQVVKCSQPLSEGEESLWHRHEQVLANVAIDSELGRLHQGEWLRNLQIDSLTTSAATMPIRVNGRVLGALCLTRRGQDDALENRRQLIEFGAETLSQTLQRFVEDAAIRRQARHDHLTDLVNRRSFDAYLATEIERVERNESPACSLILADLDRFKSINDRYGHQGGDNVLRETARVMAEQVGKLRLGERSIVARYGGEEFAIILPNVGLAGAMRIAEGIRSAIAAESIAVGSTTLHVTISIGVAECTQQTNNPTSLVAAADQALYQAKESGRNCVCQAGDPNVTTSNDKPILASPRG